MSMTGRARSRRPLPIAIASMVMFWSGSARAQQVAATFEELPSLIKPGETIYVTDVAGATSKGRFAGLSASLQLLVQRGTSTPARSLSERDVNNIMVERSDPLWNGMLIGFVSGAVPVALIGAGAVSASGGEVAAVAAGYGGIGLLTGLLIDVLNKEKVPIYVQRPAQRSTRIYVSPVRLKAGAAIQISAQF
jgi:hypothetical protein